MLKLMYIAKAVEIDNNTFRGVAQFGSAYGSGP